MTGLEFEWDEDKAFQNKQMHRVSFDNAKSVFSDTLSITKPDVEHSVYGEERFITIGMSSNQQLLVIVHCDRANRIRIISARRANRIEKRKYEEEI